MWRRAWELLDQAEQMRRTLFPPGGRRARGVPVWEPPVDVFETDEGFRVLVALPGVAAADVEVELDGRQLTVRALRRRPADCSEAEVRRLEIPFGLFERRLELPAGPFALARRRMVDGCLVLDVERV